MTLLKKLYYLLKKNPNYFFILFLNFLRENITLKLFGKFGFSPFPSLITILITKRCNFNCLGCSSASPAYTKHFGKNKEKDLSLNDIKKILDQVAWFKPFIYLNGGEPTLRPDLLEIVEYVKRKNLVCALTTNGSMFNRRFLESLIKTKLDFLSVSIDGPRPFHDKIRGFDGAFGKAALGIRILAEFKKKYKINYPHIRLASIIYPNNLDNSKYIIGLANELEVDEIGFGLLMYYPKKIIALQKNFVDKNKTGGFEPIGLEINSEYKFDFSKERYLSLLKYAKQNAKMPVFFAYGGKQFKQYFDPQVFPKENSRCLTPWNSLLIHPNGDLGICQGFIFGSIYKGSILGQWNNQEIVRFRKKRGRMSFPACFRCNEGQILKFDYK